MASHDVWAPAPESEPACDCEADHLPETADAVATTLDPPKPVPTGDPVPFARSSVSPTIRVWPVDTTHSSRLIVSYETVDGKIRGRPGRRFLASRQGGKRFHVGIDLFANEGDVVVACEDGRIVNFYEFYPSSAGEMTYALLVAHKDFVVNYGEVKGASPKVFKWKIGDNVVAGRQLAHVSSTSMTHFETYQPGTTHNHRWNPGHHRPPELLDPTAYLLELASKSSGVPMA